MGLSLYVWNKLAVYADIEFLKSNTYSYAITHSILQTLYG